MSILFISSKDNLYFVNYKDCLIGYKEFVIDKNGILSNYFVKQGKSYNRYKYRFIKRKNYGLISTKYEFIISNKSNQKRCMILNIQYFNGKEYDDYDIVKEIKGGYFVECFSLPELSINKIKEYELPIGIVVPVIFKISDINNFDSERVLVKQFAFIPPDIFNNIIFPKKVKRIKNYVHYYEWLKNMVFKK